MAQPAHPALLRPHLVEPEPRADDHTRLVASRFRAFLEALGLDLRDPHLAGTDLRVARAYQEMFAGLSAPEPRLTTFPNEEGYRGLVTVAGIRFYSICGHHLLPFFGRAHVAYLPGERVLGLSKLARVVEHHARRPQVQERLGEEVAELLERRLGARGVIVALRARHLCMEMRGVRSHSAQTTTISARGALRRGTQRREFLQQAGLARSR